MKGGISQADLIKNLSGIFCKNKQWSWQVRTLSEKRFLVRFPPWKNVDELIEFPDFDLPINGVFVTVEKWTGAIDPFSELTEAWVVIEGLSSKWCTWKVFSHIASCFGILVDVDWNGLMESFYEKVRIKIAYKNPAKIPFERIMEMRKKLYIISFTVEGFEQIGVDDPNDDK